jgi:hypothetical protein
LLLDTGLWIFDDNVDFVLENNDLTKVHDGNSSQMLTGLWLRTRLVSCNKQESRVHDCCTSKHGSHQDIVTWAINE